MRILPWRNYDQMLADGNLPSRGDPERLAIIMAESYKRGLCQAAIVSAIGIIVFFIYSGFR